MPRLWRAASPMFLLLAICLMPCGTAQAGVTLRFSDFSSDSTPVSALRAEVDFTVAGSQLRIAIRNSSQYKIAKLFFNSDPTLSGLAFAGSVNPAWSISGTGLSQTMNANGFGNYNWLVDFGTGHNRLEAGSTTEIVLNMTGTTSEATIATKLSSIPPGHDRAISVLKFEAGPGDDSAYGASISAVPEPATASLALSGLAASVFVGLYRLRRTRPEAV